MSETIQVALITLLAGFVGAIGGLCAAKISADAQVKQTVIQECFKKRADAYTAVFHAHIEVIGAPRSPDAILKLRTAIEEALVVASPDTTARLLIFQEALVSHNNERISSVKTDLAIFMQKDLATFVEPKLIKNKWDSPFTKFKRFFKWPFIRRDHGN